MSEPLESAIDLGDRIIDLAVPLARRFGRAVVIGFLVGGSLLLLGVPVLKAVVAGLVAFTMYSALGRTLVKYGMLLLTAYALAVWIGAAPAPVTVENLAQRTVDRLLDGK